MNLRVVILTLIVACIGLPPSARAVEHDDNAIILDGGIVHVGGVQPTGRASERAILIEDRHIVFVGSFALARRRSPRADIIELRGAHVYPGFVDAHAHLFEMGQWESMLNLEGAPSLAAVMRALRDRALSDPSPTLQGYSWIETHWPEHRMPNRDDLDSIDSRRVVVLTRIDGHAAVVNSAGLRLADIDQDTPDPPGGRIERDSHGRATGLLIDTALNLVMDRIPEPTIDERRHYLELGIEHVRSMGWTGLHNLEVTATDLALLNRLAADGKLPIRVDNFMRLSDAETVLSHGPSNDPTGLVRVRGVKLYADGALGSRGAALFDPYTDVPSTRGVVVTDTQDQERVMERALSSCAQVAVHAIGDRGNHITLDAMQQALEHPHANCPDPRWRIEHAQILLPSDIPRFHQLGIIASMQPSHAISDLYFAPDRLGAGRLLGAYAWRSLLDSGAVIAAGSDAPVERGDPRVEFYAATRRHSLTGYSNANWHQEQSVSSQSALRMLSWAPAYAVHRESELGTIAPGMLADLSVFSVDFTTATSQSLLNAKALLTVVDGRVVLDTREP